MSFKPYFLYTLCISTGLTFAASAAQLQQIPPMPVPTQSQIPKPIIQAAEHLIHTEETPGMTIVYLQKGHQPTILSLGNTDYDKAGFIITPETRFEIGSLTKLFTGLLAAQCVERKDCTLQDPLAKHIQWPLSASLANTSLKALLTHTSGLPALPTNFSPAQEDNPYADYDLERLKTYLAEATPESPGHYSYSNVAYGILGYTLIKPPQQSLIDVMQTQILSPLHMQDTSFEDLESLKLTALPHHMGQTTSPWHFQDTTAGAGALRSNGKDMARFLAAQMNPEKTPFAASLRRSQELLVPRSGQSPFGLGYGWHQISLHNKTLYFHNGQTGGFSSFIGFDAQRERGAVILSNSPKSVEHLGMALVLPEIPAPALKDMRRTPQDLARYTGRFQLTPELIFTLEQHRGYLYAQLTGQSALKIYPMKNKAHTFRYASIPAKISFSEDLKTLILHQNGEHQATRITDN